MGIKIKSDFDSIADDALNITGSATGWASRMSDVVDALKSNNNELGTAALTDKTTTGTTGDSGKVPALNSDGKINAVQLPTATAGGSANSGLVPILDASGLLASTMIPSGSGGGGGGSSARYIWVYDDTGGSYIASTRQWRHTWTPRNAQNQVVNISSILIYCTGGGGTGAYGPAATVSDGAPGGGSIAGHAARKGGGGAAGSTVIAFRTGITSTSSFVVNVGSGGDPRPHPGVGTRFDGSASTFGSDITAGGGGTGNPLGNGGSSASGGIGTGGFGVYLFGGPGADGSFDRLGGGSGGGSFWGSGYSGGNGRGSGQNAPPGAGGGAAHGSMGVPPFTFQATAEGKPGNHGLVIVLGF